jgi:hypothetical protein
MLRKSCNNVRRCLSAKSTLRNRQAVVIMSQGWTCLKPCRHAFRRMHPCGCPPNNTVQVSRQAGAAPICLRQKPHNNSTALHLRVEHRLRNMSFAKCSTAPLTTTAMLHNPACECWQEHNAQEGNNSKARHGVVGRISSCTKQPLPSSLSHVAATAQHSTAKHNTGSQDSSANSVWLSRVCKHMKAAAAPGSYSPLQVALTCGHTRAC